MAGHRVIGVPYSLVKCAERNGDDAQRELEDLVRINARQLQDTGRDYGIWIVGVTFSLLSGLGITGFLYRVELAQAIFLLAIPLSLSRILDLVTATRIDRVGMTGDALRTLMHRQRNRIQAVGVMAIPTSAIWGLREIVPFGAIGG